MDIERIKLYKVTFNQYTNSLNDTVSTGDHKNYLVIPKTGLIIREDELNFYKNFGDGYESIQIVGEMYCKNNIQ